MHFFVQLHVIVRLFVPDRHIYAMYAFIFIILDNLLNGNESICWYLILNITKYHVLLKLFLPTNQPIHSLYHVISNEAYWKLICHAIGSIRAVLFYVQISGYRQTSKTPHYAPASECRTVRRRGWPCSNYTKPPNRVPKKIRPKQRWPVRPTHHCCISML